MKGFFFLALLGLTFPFAVQAAFDDVSLQTSADLVANGVTLQVTGTDSVVESMVVQPTKIIVVMPVSSKLRVQAVGRYKISHSASPANSAYVVSETCNSSESSAYFAPGSGSTITLTITPDANTVCGGSTAGNTGGGSGSVFPVSKPTPPPLPTPVLVLPVNTVPVFTRPLTIGATGEDVKILQQLLNRDPATLVGESGPGSPGQETSYFGGLTADAVGRFQIQYQLVSSRMDPAYGYVGPKTRAKLNELNTSTSGTVLSSQTRAALIAEIQAQIQELIRQVNQLMAARQG